MKTIGGLRKTRHRGRGLAEWFFVLTAVAYNLIRIPKLLAATGMSLSGVSNMKQNRNQYRACGPDRDPSLQLFAPQTSRKSLSEPGFSAPC
jgi:hypothetical protein